MRHLRSVRTQELTHTQQIEAVFSNPALYQLAADVEMRQPVGRPQQHPPWALLAYGVLARTFRSGAKVEVELAQADTWQRIVDVVDRMRTQHPGLEIPAAGDRAPGWDAWKHARNTYFTDPDVLAQLQQRFTELAVEQALRLGLLDPAGPGSLCHPDRSRVVYGDGTVIRPPYRPPAATRSTDPTTGKTKITYRDPAGQAIPKPTRRYDPDAAGYHGHTGSVHGQNYVALYARGDLPHQRVVLAVARVDRPGREAETAVAAIKALHTVAGGGIQGRRLRRRHARQAHRRPDEQLRRSGHQQGPRLGQDRRAQRQERPGAVAQSGPVGARWQQRSGLHASVGRGRRSRPRGRAGRDGTAHDRAPPDTQAAQAPSSCLRAVPLQRRLRGAVRERGLPGVGHSAWGGWRRRPPPRRRCPRHRRGGGGLHPPVRHPQRRRPSTQRSSAPCWSTGR